MVTKDLAGALSVYKKISNLTKVLALLEWDMQVNMPSKSSRGHAQQMAYLTELLTDLWQDKHLLSIVKQNTKKLSGLKKAYVENLKRAGIFYITVPKKLLSERAQVTAEAVSVWQEAREKNNFKLFEPWLQKIITIYRNITSYLDYANTPYDALLDLYEPELTTKKTLAVFRQIQEPLTNLLEKILAKPVKEISDFEAPISDQKKIAAFVMKQMGYDLAAGRLDESAHPFCTTLDRYDIRITTKFHEDDFQKSLMSVMHESGHALYELGINPKYNLTPLENAASYGIHESQSRLFENMVGRSEPFLSYLIPQLEKISSMNLKSSLNEITLAFNAVKKTPIRIDADEVSYNLHIMVRFEIEEAFMKGSLQASDIPGAWNELMKKYLHITPKNDAEGCLQDVHWSGGNIGYFPSYSLGNLYAAQFFSTMAKQVAVNSSLKKGQLKPLVSWLRANIHTFGSYYLPEDLVERATGKSLDPTYFLKYLTTKYTALYNL